MTNWISVKDRLPEHEQEGIFYDGARVLTGWWLANENAVTDAEHYERSKGITHWMPLPAAPTAEASAFDRLPPDWESPAWAEFRRTHNWHNYVSDELQTMWQTFTAEQKQAIARNANDQANREEWE